MEADQPGMETDQPALETDQPAMETDQKVDREEAAVVEATREVAVGAGAPGMAETELQEKVVEAMVVAEVVVGAVVVVVEAVVEAEAAVMEVMGTGRRETTPQTKPPATKKRRTRRRTTTHSCNLTATRVVPWVSRSSSSRIFKGLHSTSASRGAREPKQSQRQPCPRRLQHGRLLSLSLIHI